MNWQVIGGLSGGFAVLLFAGVPSESLAEEKAFGSPSPAAEQKQIVERKVEEKKFTTRTGPTAAEQAKKELAGKPKPAVTQFDDPMERNRALIEAKQAQIEDRRQQLLVKLKAIFERVQQQGGNPAREAELLHRMAELEWESARYYYFQKRFEYEKLMDEHLAGKRKDKPEEPKADYSKAMDYYRRVLRDHPAYGRIDEVVYYLGDGMRLIGKDGDAAPYFQKLVKNYEKSKFVADALLGLAEYFFKSDLLFAARDTYLKIINQHPDSRAFNYALYKLGWAYFNLGGMEPKSFRLAIDTFKRVIDTIDKDGAKAEKSKIEFRDQALKDLVVAFAAVPTGTDEAREYFMKRGGMKMAQDMLDRLAKFYLAGDKDEEAIGVYRWFMQVEPNSVRLVEWEETILESLKKIAKFDRIEKEMLLIVEKFGPKGSWMAANAKNAELVKKARDLAENSLEYLASHHHQEAQRLKDDKLYAKAADFYKLFIDTFPDSPKAYRARFFLAEITFIKLDKPELAAKYYEDVVKQGQGEFLADAAYGRISCYHKLMQADRNRTKVGGAFKYAKVKKGEKAAKLPEARAIPQWEQKFVEASDDYVKLVQKPDDAVPVMYNAAEIFFYNNHYDDAVKRYAYIVDNYPTHKYALHSANNILESYNRLRRWHEIEVWAKRLRDNPKFKARKRTELEKFIALAIFNQANDLRGSKDHDKAAAELLRLQNEIPASEMSDEALFSAASLYSEGKKHDLAIETFKKLLKAYPRSAKASQATFLIGAIHEGLADFAPAVEFYEKRTSYKDKTSDEARNALFNAGLLRQALGQEAKALELMNTLISRFPKHEDTKQIYFRIADIYEARKDWSRALGLYRRYISTFPKSFWIVKAQLRSAIMHAKLGKNRQVGKELADVIRVGKRFIDETTKAADKATVRSWVAHARFLEGEALFAEYKAVRFKLPQRVMKKQIIEKAKLLKKVTDAFEDVLNYKSAGRSSCALWKIGQTYQEFSQSLMEAPIPPGLTADEEQVYKIKLQEKALPVEEKAFEAYARNLKLAAENNVFNGCVQQSGEALARSKPEEFPVIKEELVKVDHAPDGLLTSPVLDPQSAPAKPVGTAPAPTTGGTPHASR
jgi:TolA-binding protein